MIDAYQYTALINSLPACRGLFNAKNTPISRYQLQQRLSVLEPQDAEDLVCLLEVIDWCQQPRERTDQQLLITFRKNSERIHSQQVRDMLHWRMSFRSVIAGLRRRNLGESQPRGDWGYGRWLPLMKKHWQEPTLGLEKVLPWVNQAVQYLKENRSYELEKLIMREVWLWLDRQSWEHQFDFAAVAIYRMRWDLIARWVAYDQGGAKQRFERMADEVVSAAGLSFCQQV